jgi:hypothetical protein
MVLAALNCSITWVEELVEAVKEAGYEAGSRENVQKWFVVVLSPAPAELAAKALYL